VAETLQVLLKNNDGIRHPTEDGLPCAVLQYADDTLVVLRGDISGAMALRYTLDSFASLMELWLSFRF
jgi:hypothetical protein